MAAVLSFPLLFQPIQLGAVAGDIFNMPTAPASTVLKNGRVRLTNTTAAAVDATLYSVPAGDTAGADNCCLSAQSIAAHSFLDVDIPSMAAGGKLRGFAGAAASITVHEMGGALWS